jgi:ribonuclease HII
MAQTRRQAAQRRMALRRAAQRRAEQREAAQREAAQLEAALAAQRRAAWPRPAGYTPRRDGGLAGYERVLARAGLAPVAGIDEAGRGACAGPLVVAAVILQPSRVVRISDLADSKMLTEKIREEAFAQIMAAASDVSVLIIPAADIDRHGLHVCNVAGMRRALAGLAAKPGYVLTDGFPVRGLATPALAMWKGDQVSASVAAASIVAKVTRDRLMCDLAKEHPEYGFESHKGYSTRSHMRALAAHGPCSEHRRSFVNVDAAVRARLLDQPESLADADLAVDPFIVQGNGQNGPIVDLSDEYGWPTVGVAAGARDACSEGRR